MFSILTAKIFAGVSGLLLLGLGFTLWLLSNANGTIETQRGQIATLEAEKAVQNAAIRAAAAEGDRQRAAFTSAVESGQRAIAEAQGRIRVVRQTAPNGCATPSSIREAGL